VVRKKLRTKKFLIEEIMDHPSKRRDAASPVRFKKECAVIGEMPRHTLQMNIPLKL
jgi:hypothetical protein